jgi:hypothetical protein
MPKTKKFDPNQSFESATEAIELCKQQPDPRKAAMQIVNANIDMGEYGFAAEVVQEMETL